MKDEAADLLRKGISELGISCGEKQIGSFIIYLSELKKWNRAYNLTGLKSDRDIIIKHFLDSLLFIKVFPAEASTVADIGSGAGFPGIPIKIALPDLKVVLIEPTRKKATFLKHIRDRLGLADMEIIEERVENVRGLKGDVAVTRALFTVSDFIEKTRGMLNENGVLILNKGPKVKDELKGLDMKNIALHDFKLPFEKMVRHLVVVKKDRES